MVSPTAVKPVVLADDSYVAQVRPNSSSECANRATRGHSRRLVSGAQSALRCLRRDRLNAVEHIASDAAAALANARVHDELKRAFTEIKDLKDQLETENVYLREEIRGADDFEEIVGNSAAVRPVFHLVEQVAPTRASVLLLVETGTGKELVARAIHNRSTRGGRPLIKVNCAALPATLIESELFGHEKGAFTGALTKRASSNGWVRPRPPKLTSGSSRRQT